MEVNYKKKRYYNTAKYPIRQPLVIVGLIWLLSKIVLIGKKYKVEKTNMEGLKPPYMLLSSHTEPFRAEGLHKVLYQCPHCLTESKMASKGTEIFCTKCGKRWNLNEDGALSALEGETEFSHVPDWFEWEREQVRAQIERGEYSFADDVEVYSLPRCWRFTKLGAGKLTHDPEEGFVLEGFHNGSPYRIQRTPIETNSLHIEYDYCYIKPFDCVDISTEKDSFYCYPKQENVVTKLAFATEELYQRSAANGKTRVQN